MALNKDVLGSALNSALAQFQDKTPDELGDINAARLEFCKVIAEQVINHFIANAVVSTTVNTTVATTGTATAQTGTGTGTGTGTIS